MQRINTANIPYPFAEAIECFIRIQEGRNRSNQTIRAYRSDLSQLAEWLHQDNPLLTHPVEVTTDDLHEFSPTWRMRRFLAPSAPASWRRSASFTAPLSTST